MTKQKFLPLLFDFIGTLAVDLPKIFISSHPIYRAARRNGLSQKRVISGMRNLDYRGYVKKNAGGYSLTARGKKWFNASRHKYFHLYNKKWDKKWRVIIFDIPSELQKKRHSLRYKLRMLGAYMIQKSVFVFPYQCEEEIGFWCRELGLSDHVDVITTDHIGSKEEHVKKVFELK